MGGMWRRLEEGIPEGTRQVQSSGLGHLSLGGFEGMRRLEAGKVSSLRTFQKVEPPARVVNEAKLGSSATSCLGQIRGQEYVCVFVCVCVCVCVSICVDM